VTRLRRFAVYGLVGWGFDIAYTTLHDAARGRPLRFRSSPWNVPVYGLAQPLFEPVHDRLRDRPWPVRAGVYGVGILAVEYASGWVLRRVRGRAPWDYTDARWHVHGLIRPDYFPLWAAVGLAAERLHDALTAGRRE
jgi:uncharacterized membrane protein